MLLVAGRVPGTHLSNLGVCPVPEPVPYDFDPGASEPFRRWRRAVAALRAAESRGEPYPVIVRLSAEVIRTRNEMTMDRLRAGWSPPEEILRDLSADERLLLEKDDADRV